MTPYLNSSDVDRKLRSPANVERLEQIGAAFGCVIHVARIIGKKRWSYVAGSTDSDMLTVPVKRVYLDDGYGAILYLSQPLPRHHIQQLTSQLNTFLESVRRL